MVAAAGDACGSTSISRHMLQLIEPNRFWIGKTRLDS